MPEQTAPTAFHIMAKPTGSACNLNCDYCFFLKKAGLYPDSNFRMSEEVHEAYIRQLFDAHNVPHVTVAWQGGEPTLMGLDFFRRSIELQKKYRKPATRVENTFQTNGILLNDEWCQFFYENNFLIGLSMDGPEELHDFFRKDKGGNGTFNRVIRAARLLQKHKVEFNILCTVNRKNADHALEVYRFFRDEMKTNYIQFIPIVERDDIHNPSPSPSPSRGEGNNTALSPKGDDVTNISPPLRGGDEGEGVVTDRSVLPEQWGRFLIEIFDEWVKKDVGQTFILNFDGALAGWLGMAGTVCIFARNCGVGMALEHNGDLYSCDHFVDPDNFLGNILHTPMIELVASDKQRKFGRDKRDTLPRYCLKCEVLHICNGECPKNRLLTTPDGETGLNYLCEGYKAFFRHADIPMQIMADLIRKGRLAEEVMKVTAMEKEGEVTKPNNQRKDKTMKTTYLPIFIVFVLWLILVTAARAETVSSPPSTEAEQETRVADKTGTDPSNFQRTFSLANEYTEFAHSGAYLNTTTLTYIEPMKNGRARITLELPFAGTDVTGQTDSGLADLTVRYGQILHIDRSKAFAAGLGLVAPTATEDSLGTGKWSLEPSASVILFLSREWIVAPAFKQTVSFAGDSNRADVNLSTFDFYVVWRSSSLKEWVIVDPAFAWNWEKDRDQLIGITTLTYGRLLGRTGKAVWSGYVKPGVGWGNGRASDWSIEAGLKVVGL